MPHSSFKDHPNIIEIRDLTVKAGEHEILKNVNLDVKKDEILGIVGKSGSGKTTLFRSILQLQRWTGKISIFDKDIETLSEKQLIPIQRRWGVLFQQGALFSSLSVLENVLFPLRTITNLDNKLQTEIAILKIALTGLPLSAIHKYPAELSGGMLKRAALARAIVLDPELLLLDEPSSGLDPYSAHALDQLILDLRKSLNLTIILVTHDLDTLWTATDRVAFLGNGTILATEPMDKLMHLDHPMIEEYFSGCRAERAKERTKLEGRENDKE